MPSKQARLDQIAADIVTHNICPDLAKQATQLVLGTGNVNADVVFIGEAPGKREDLTGEPFVGASGRFLNEMLASIGLSREDVYITNIVKYRPPDNRDPTTQEKQDFLPYLQSQLEVISPKLIVTLGRHSANCFLPDLQISTSHGQPQSLRLEFKQTEASMEVMFLPLYHPAAALYNGRMRQILIDDFAIIPTLL